MQDIVAIKIGCNENEVYNKFDKLHKHLDIVDILPRKKDKQGNLLSRTMGIMGDKEFLGLSVDMNHLDDSLFLSFREFLTKNYEDRTVASKDITVMGNKVGEVYEQLQRRKYYIDIDSYPQFDLAFKSKISQQVSLKSSKDITFDMTTVNRFDKVVTFLDFCKMVKSKQDGLALIDFIPEKFKTKEMIDVGIDNK